MGTGPGTAARRKDPSIVQNKGPDVHQGRKNHPLPQPDLVLALKAGTRTVFYSSTAKPLLELMVLIQDCSSSSHSQRGTLTDHTWPAAPHLQVSGSRGFLFLFSDLFFFP